MSPRRHPLAARRGVTLIYALVMMLVLVAFVSFAVDFARVQLAKTELQMATDSAARYGASGLSSGPAVVKTRITSAAADNTVDGTPLIIDPNLDIEFGNWNSTTRTFTPVTGTAQASAKALRVTAKRTAARGTAVSL